MVNMSYCRFQNTVRDLRDCSEHLEDDLSPEEEQARKGPLQLCRDILDDAETFGLTESSSDNDLHEVDQADTDIQAAEDPSASTNAPITIVPAKMNVDGLLLSPVWTAPARAIRVLAAGALP